MSPKVAHTRMKIQPTEWGKMPTIPILNKNVYEKRFFSLMHDQLLQLCWTVCDPMDCSPPGSSVHGILQARILE